MSVFCKSVMAGILCTATAMYAYDINLTDTVIVDDFNNAYGDSSNQSALGAVYGILAFSQSWSGGGYWSVYADAGGSSVKNASSETIVSGTNDNTIVTDSVLHVKFSTGVSTASDKYAGLNCNLVSSGTRSLDLTKMTSVELLAKGSGTFRLSLQTEDYSQAGFTWGYYGHSVTLPADWTKIVIPVDSLVPEAWSDALGANWTWSHGMNSVLKIDLGVKSGADAELYVDYIKLNGITYGSLGLTTRIADVQSAKINKSAFLVTSSMVSFNLPKSQNVSLSVYDMQGHRVRNIYKGTTASEEISWNSRELTSGSYLAVLSGSGIYSTQPLIITK